MYCKEYVAHYLRRVYPYHKFEEFVQFPPSSIVRHTFLNTLEKKFHPSSDYNVKVFPAKVQIVIRVNDLSQYGVSVKPALHYHINSVFEEKIKNELFFIITKMRDEVNGLSLRDAILAYQKMYNFKEETFSYEAIAQSYQRCKPKIFYKNSA